MGWVSGTAYTYFVSSHRKDDVWFRDNSVELTRSGNIKVIMRAATNLDETILVYGDVQRRLYSNI